MFPNLTLVHAFVALWVVASAASLSFSISRRHAGTHRDIAWRAWAQEHGFALRPGVHGGRDRLEGTLRDFSARLDWHPGPAPYLYDTELTVTLYPLVSERLLVERASRWTKLWLRRGHVTLDEPATPHGTILWVRFPRPRDETLLRSELLRSKLEALLETYPQSQIVEGTLKVRTSKSVAPEAVLRSLTLATLDVLLAFESESAAPLAATAAVAS